MECFVGHNPEMMLSGDENRQLQCQELIELNDQIAQDNSVSHMNDYAILPAVNLCPITWGIGNLEIVETGQSGFIEIGQMASSSAPTSVGRIRRKPRPYSPSETTAGIKKSKQKPRVIKVQKLPNSVNEVHIDKRTGEPFSCDKCKSPHIVDPTRCSPGNRKRPPIPRKYVDPNNGRIMLLCNACGIAAKTNRKDRTTKATRDAESVRQLKDQYLTESMNFAKKLSYECNEPELAALYCPSFSGKGCNCIAKYLFSGANSTAHERRLKVLDLLSYHRKARELNTNRNFSNTKEEDCDLRSGKKLHIDECEDNFIEGCRKPHYKCKSRDFEKFALTSRIKLRSEYALCEKTTQKILMYSNNFLHKESKTAPQRGPRVDKTIKRTARLKPILEMHKEYCCGNGCTKIASSHANLLEEWRRRASLCQKDARRVIAEMLTPTGGTKANCYRFIKMVTGCCVATIFLVNEHMKKTKGDREPPEHGLKRYWRRKSKSYKTATKSCDPNNANVNLGSDASLIPSDEELLSMGTEAASTLLQSKKEQLEYLQNKLQRAESRLKLAAETTPMQEIQPVTLVNEFRQEVQGNIFVLGQDGVIRPWKSDPPYLQIVTQGNG